MGVTKPKESAAKRKRDKLARDALIIKLVEAGCSTASIVWYVGISHGTITNVIYRHNITHRKRGRPAAGSPPPPHPVDVMGEDYIPEYYTEEEREAFKKRIAEGLDQFRQPSGLGYLHIQDMKIPAEDMIEVSPLVPPVTPPSSPAEVVASRIPQTEEDEDEPIMY